MEQRITQLEMDIAIIKANYCTKADLHEEINKQTKWIASIIIGTAGLTVALAKLLF
ncbi:hypothetical protein N5923_16930 [Erwiniaceae bacterium BAC15a-03b]|uniref:Hemolysin XhlA n=1 Tax=Winslowiella arboricola TaxID=2978220 RepID=A0A9J6PLH8_9GAMM|nr:hypothetical protein [Winslowiella arboricola]MCU5773283.1 hypothetical protein [Winslowiella arboricola]MCU5779169.1 hypothetical protein [Winslowiella arboricola]